jgi:hypothetical protein
MSSQQYLNPSGDPVPLNLDAIYSPLVRRYLSLRILYLFFVASGQHAVHTSPPAKRQVLHEQGRSGAINTVAAVIIFVF